MSFCLGCKLLISVFIVAASLAWCATEAEAYTVLYLPLDERFATRFAFLNLAAVTPFNILTPPMADLSHEKEPANLSSIDAWMAKTLPIADAAVVSTEMFLYGGLIASRCSNDSTAAIESRVDTLFRWAEEYPKVKWYLSAVVMRIPSYNEDVEEPWYWAYYGLDLFQYSYYLDKYNTTHDPADLNTAITAESKVPSHIVQEFVLRRQRNFNVSSYIVQSVSAHHGVEAFYITQDDHAEYGFNVEEARRLKDLVASLSLQNTIRIYPGADEVGLTLLSHASVNFVYGNRSPTHRLRSKSASRLSRSGKVSVVVAYMANDGTGEVGAAAPLVQLVFRDPSTINLVPNYEGQPMIDTLVDMIIAGGAQVWNETVHRDQSPDLTLLVNNFSEFPQLEAPNQPMTGRSIADYSMFTPYICNRNGSVSRTKMIGFTDNRYSNGGDRLFVEYMLSLSKDKSCAWDSDESGGLSMNRLAYAGWNTDGNTLGTVVSNTIILATFKDSANTTANAYFNSLRLLEDDYYQADIRQQLQAYVAQVNGDTDNTLNHDTDFYERFSFKLLNSKLQNVCSAFRLPFVLDSVYYPWHRTFEIGLFAS